jgi:ferredoxin
VANSSTLKVRVDRDKCQGHNRCKALAPELFELDEYGNAREKGDGTVPPGLEEKAYAKSTARFASKSSRPEKAMGQRRGQDWATDFDHLDPHWVSAVPDLGRSAAALPDRPHRPVHGRLPADTLRGRARGRI